MRKKVEEEEMATAESRRELQWEKGGAGGGIPESTFS